MLTKIISSIKSVKNYIANTFHDVSAYDDKQANLLVNMSKDSLYKHRLRNLDTKLYSLNEKNFEPMGL